MIGATRYSAYLRCMSRWFIFSPQFRSTNCLKSIQNTYLTNWQAHWSLAKMCWAIWSNVNSDFSKYTRELQEKLSWALRIMWVRVGLMFWLEMPKRLIILIFLWHGIGSGFRLEKAITYQVKWARIAVFSAWPQQFNTRTILPANVEGTLSSSTQHQKEIKRKSRTHTLE